METLSPNDSLKASLSPPVSGRLCSFRRLANKQMLKQRVQHYYQWLRSTIIGVPVHLPPFRPSYGPTGLYNHCKGSKADGPHKGSQTSPIPGQLAYQGPISEGSTSEHSHCGRPDTVLRVDNKSREVRTQTYSGVFVRGVRLQPRFSPNFRI